MTVGWCIWIFLNIFFLIQCILLPFSSSPLLLDLLPPILSTFSHFLNDVGIQNTDFLSIWFTASFQGDFQTHNPLVFFPQVSSVFILSQPLPCKATSYTWSQFRSALLLGRQVLKSFLSPSSSTSFPVSHCFPLIFIDTLAHDQATCSITWIWAHCFHSSLNTMVNHFNGIPPTILSDISWIQLPFPFLLALLRTLAKISHLILIL